MLSTIPCSGFLYLQFLARCHPYIFDFLSLSGLDFELFYTGITIEEDVGTVELCVRYMGDNVPRNIAATIPQIYGKLHCILVVCCVRGLDLY